MSEQPMSPCEVCWFSAWEPVPPDDPDAQEVLAGPLKGQYVRCGHCWLRAQLSRVEGERERIRALWPHIEIPVGPQRFLHGKREVADPGAPTCLRCKIEEAIRG